MTDELRALLDEREERSKERMIDVLKAIETLRHDIRASAQSIHERLDRLHQQVNRHDDRISVLEQKTSYTDGTLAGRLSPSKETRLPGDEEMSIRVTPRMWAALVAVGGVLWQCRDARDPEEVEVVGEALLRGGDEVPLDAHERELERALLATDERHVALGDEMALELEDDVVGALRERQETRGRPLLLGHSLSAYLSYYIANGF